MSKPRPRLSLGPEGAKPQTTPSEQGNSRIAYKTRDDHHSQPPGRDRGNRDGSRDNRSPYDSRDNRGRDDRGGYGSRDNRNGPRDDRGSYGNRDRDENAPRFGGNSERGERGSYGNRDNRSRDDRGGYGNRDNRNGPRDDRGSYGNRDRGENAPRFGGNSERGERGSYGNRDNRSCDDRGSYGNRDNRSRDDRGSYGNRDNRSRDDRGGYGSRDNRDERSPQASSSDPWRTAQPKPVAERAPLRARHVSAEQPVAAAEASDNDTFTPRGLGSDERKIYGVNSCEQFYKLHPDQVIRAYFTEASARAKFGPLMKSLAANKRAYHVISSEELEKVTESQHHEGVCLVIKLLPELQLGDWLASLPEESNCCVLLLDGIANPHNLGAIMRTAAHYRVGAIISDNAQALRSGAAMRTAEGGALHVPVVSSGSLVAAMLALKEQGFTVYATASRESADLYRTKLPARCAFIMGEEQHGVSAPCMAAADKKLLIGGSGLVESLNVIVAAALLSAEYWRQHEVVGAAKTARSGKAKAAKATTASAEAVATSEVINDVAASAEAEVAAPAKAVKARAVKAKPQTE